MTDDQNIIADKIICCGGSAQMQLPQHNSQTEWTLDSNAGASAKNAKLLLSERARRKDQSVIARRPESRRR